MIGGFSSVVFVAFFLSSICLPVNASTTPASVQARIFYAVLPMTSADATKLAEKLIANGIDHQHHADLVDSFRTTVFGDSVPIVLQAAGGPLCLAAALRYDVDQVMKVSPDKSRETEKAITTFLLNHEASHCKKILSQMRGERSWPVLDAQMTDADFWLEETLADLDARVSLRKLGIPGQHAIKAWERYRLFGLLKGNLEHWTTPLIPMIKKTGAKDKPPLDLSALEPGGVASYEAMHEAWSKLRKAIFMGADKSAEQAAAWNSAVHAFPVALRPAIPSLIRLRVLSRKIWPDAPDWRYKATARRLNPHHQLPEAPPPPKLPPPPDWKPPPPELLPELLDQLLPDESVETLRLLAEESTFKLGLMSNHIPTQTKTNINKITPAENK